MADRRLISLHSGIFLSRCVSFSLAFESAGNNYLIPHAWNMLCVVTLHAQVLDVCGNEYCVWYHLIHRMYVVMSVVCAHAQDVCGNECCVW